ncbi:MAG: hypothetical protein NTX24_03850 [Candidatus Pacearchaeota archaeon]|nr:hypothetical protein [Candidatus Pacearchaeota archaeon]
MTADTLNPEEIKTFFQNFLVQYQQEVENNFTKGQKQLILYNNLPAKIELLFDKEKRYCIVLLSKNKKSEFSMEDHFQDVLMVVATANSKKYEYGEKGSFLYLFQLNAKRFVDWEVQRFVRDFINYEVTKNNK